MGWKKLWENDGTVFKGRCGDVALFLIEDTELPGKVILTVSDLREMLKIADAQLGNTNDSSAKTL